MDSNVTDNSNVEELLVGIYIHFDYSSKWKFFVEFCELCDKYYC